MFSVVVIKMSLALRLARIPCALFAFRQVMMERETVEDQLMKLRQSEIDRFQAEQEAAELAAKIAREKVEALEAARAVGLPLLCLWRQGVGQRKG